MTSAVSGASWMCCPRSRVLLAQPASPHGSSPRDALRPAPPARHVAIWTDDYANVLSIVRWN
jgi:hypothetical protein